MAPKTAEKSTKKVESKKAETKAESKKTETKKVEKSTEKAASKKAESKKSESKKTEKRAESKKTETPAEPQERVKRDPATKESFRADFETLENKLKETIKESLSGEGKRRINEWFRLFQQLHKDAKKLVKVPGNRGKNSDKSGFKKPVTISKALADFCSANADGVIKFMEANIQTEGEKSKYFGKDLSIFRDWDIKTDAKDETKGKHSRDKVTIFLCAYVANKNLRKEGNKKLLIFDDALQKLFNLKSKEQDNNGNDLSYTGIQSLLTDHYPEPKTQKKPKSAKPLKA
jgi:hypothetical protein